MDDAYFLVFWTVPCSCSGTRRPSLARVQRLCRRERSSYLKVRAADNSKSEDVLDVKKLGIIPFDEDHETFADVMGFTGPAPEVGSY